MHFPAAAEADQSLTLGEPVAGAGAMALDAADRDSGLRRKDPVVGRLVCQFTNRDQADVDGGRRQTFLLEGQTVFSLWQAYVSRRTRASMAQSGGVAWRR